MGIGWYHSAEVAWGDVPTWLSAAATFLALIFAAVAAVAARRTFEIESERDRVSEAARRTQEMFARSSQAALVSAWWGVQDGHAGAFVRNASNAPVYQAYLTAMNTDEAAVGGRIHCPVLPPNDVAAFFPVALAEAGDAAFSDPAAPHRVKLCFTDAAGVRWMRNQFGRLTELGAVLRIKTDQARADTFSQFREDFLATYGVNIEYQLHPGDYRRPNLIADALSNPTFGALIAPHDWIGALLAHDIIEPTALSPFHREAFPPWTLEVLSVGQRLYGIPMATDTVALLRNTDLAPDPPRTFEELISVATNLRRAGKVVDLLCIRVGEYGDAFQMWPLFASAGGRLFGTTAAGGWNPSDIRIADSESVNAFARLGALGEAGDRVLRRSMDREEALESFASGRSAFLMTTADGMLYARQAGIPFSVTGVPGFADGAAATAFTAVHTLLIAKRGAGKEIAHDLFADYLTQPRILEALSREVICPVAVRARPARDPGIREYQRLCENATPIPTFPQMELVWRAVATAQASVIGGAPADTAAETAANEIAELFAGEAHRTAPPDGGDDTLTRG